MRRSASAITMASANSLPDTSANDLRARVAEALRGLRFGVVEIQVHDSRVVRITRTEKILIEAPVDRSK